MLSIELLAKSNNYLDILSSEEIIFIDLESCKQILKKFFFTVFIVGRQPTSRACIISETSWNESVEENVEKLKCIFSLIPYFHTQVVPTFHTAFTLHQSLLDNFNNPGWFVAVLPL